MCHHVYESNTTMRQSPLSAAKSELRREKRVVLSGDMADAVFKWGCREGMKLSYTVDGAFVVLKERR